MPRELVANGYTPLEETLPRLESLVSPYTGIVSSIVELLPARSEMRLTTVACTLAASDELLGAATVEHTGGVAESAEVARAAAIGEAVERYAGAADVGAGATVTTAGALGDAALSPESLTLFHPAQHATASFPFTPYDTTTRLRFVPATQLPGGKHVLVPAQLVRLARPPEDEDPIGYATSNGLACAGTFDEAVLGGVLELVERDAFMIVWSNRLALPLLDLQRDDELETFCRRHLAHTGLRYSAVDASCFFGIPVVVGVVHGPPDDAGLLGVGAAAAPTVQEAARKALSEACSVQRGARDLALAAAAIPAAEEIADFDGHILFYCDPANAARAAFLDSSEERRALHDVPPLLGTTPTDLVHEVTALLAAQDVTAYAVDVTTADVREAGLVVARVLSPQLCPLDVLHLARFLGPRRLYTAAHDVGLVPQPLTLRELNHDPHPFP